MITETTIHGRNVARGTEVSIRGRGRMRFHYLTPCDHGGCYTFIDKNHQFATFHLEMVKTVHYKNKLRGGR